MIREFVRDGNGKLIGTRLVLERGTYINKLEEARNNLFRIENSMSYKCEKLLKRLSRKNKNKILKDVDMLKKSRIEVEKQIDELLNARVYDHFKENRFDVEYSGEIKLIDIMTPEQKEQQEYLNKKYNLIRMNRTGIPLIKLEENNYKK